MNFARKNTGGAGGGGAGGYNRGGNGGGFNNNNGGGMGGGAGGAAAAGGGAGGQPFVGKPTRPMTVRQLYNAEHVGDSALCVDGRETGTVVVCGRVTQSSVQMGTGNIGDGVTAKCHNYYITDGTGTLVARNWVAPDTDDNSLIAAGQFVTAMGAVKMQNSQPVLTGSVVVQSDNNELIFHLLDALLTHLRITRGERDITRTVVAANDSSNVAGGGVLSQQSVNNNNRFVGDSRDAAAASSSAAAAAAVGHRPTADQVQLGIMKIQQLLGKRFSAQEVTATLRTQSDLAGVTVEMVRAQLANLALSQGWIAQDGISEMWQK